MPEDAATQVTRLQSSFGTAEPRTIVEVAREAFGADLVLVSSFGADAATLLHLVATVDPTIPVIFIDTRRHFPETLAYRDRLAAQLGLRNLRSIGPTEAEIQDRDPGLDRAGWDPDGCCDFRKAVPLARALRPFRAWISGRKRHQAATRRDMSVFEVDGAHIKVNPLASWGADQVSAYAAQHSLPAHPLVAQGYRSIGCAPCTTPVEPGEDPRAGRWRQFTKTECGLHRPRHVRPPESNRCP